MQRRLAGRDQADIRGGEFGQPQLHLLGGTGDMGRHHDVRQRQQPIVRVDRLQRENVEAGAAQMAGP